MSVAGPDALTAVVDALESALGISPATAANAVPAPAPSPTPSQTMKKCEWKMKTAILRTVVAAGGTVFGGAVRDYWLHDHHAAQFYATLQRNSRELRADASRPAAAGAGADVVVQQPVIDALYNDAEYAADCRGRTVMPQDIDATIHESLVPALLEDLRAQCFTIRALSDCEPCDYIPGITLTPGQMRHRRFRIYAFSRDAPSSIRDAILGRIHDGFHPVFRGALRDFTDQLYAAMPRFPSVLLDLMVSCVPLSVVQPEPPFANLDFEANGLILTQQGIGLSSFLRSRLGVISNAVHAQKELQRILDDIGLFRARLAQPIVADYRIRKMIRKGYTITGFRDMVYIPRPPAATPATPPPADLGHCLICHGDLDGSHYKLFCCEARYHARCLFDACTIGPNAMTRTDRCPMCRTRMSLLREDAIILGTILTTRGLTAIPASVVASSSSAAASSSSAAASSSSSAASSSAASSAAASAAAESAPPSPPAIAASGRGLIDEVD